MAIIKKSDTVKITYDQKKIVLKSDTITMKVEMGMMDLMQIYSSGSGEGKAEYSVKVPDAPAPSVGTESSPVPVESKTEPVVKDVPIVVVETDKNIDDEISKWEKVKKVVQGVGQKVKEVGQKLMSKQPEIKRSDVDEDTITGMRNKKGYTDTP
jgi:hypothetical protein